MAKRLDFLPQPAVEEEEEEVDMEAEEKMCDLASQRTQKVLERFVTERLALATAGGPQKRQPRPPLRSDKVKEDKAAEEMAIKCCVRREEGAPDATAAAAEIGDKEKDGPEADSACGCCSIHVVSIPTWDA